MSEQSLQKAQNLYREYIEKEAASAAMKAQGLDQEIIDYAQESLDNLFDEKLLTLKDTIDTASGKLIAENRTKYMEEFLKEFYAEWNGEK